MGWSDKQRDRAHKKKPRGNERKRERGAANNVRMEAVEVQRFRGERWRVR